MKLASKAKGATIRHEAAHALVARLVCIPVSEVFVRPRKMMQDGKPFISLGFTGHGEEWTTELNKILLSTGPLSEEEKALLRGSMVCSYAGIIAEDREAVPDDEAITSDDRSVKIAAARLAGAVASTPNLEGKIQFSPWDGDVLRRELANVAEITESILALHEAEWEGVAIRLRRDGRMTGDQIDAFLEARKVVTRYIVGAPPDPSTREAE
jgi:hypothetical protein